MTWKDSKEAGRIGRREFVGMCAGSLALAAVGCHRGDEGGRDTLRILFPGETEETLYTESPSQFLMYLPLVARNIKGELEGWLAQSWEHSPDYQSWTVHLRRGVRWADGVPVTAHDVRFTLEFFTRPGVLQLRELQAPFQADMPATFLYPSVHTTVAHKRVRGLSSPYRVDPLLGNTEFLSLDNSGYPRAEPRGAIRLSGGLDSPEHELVYGVSSNFEWAGEDRPEV